jgi:hypothetical protein
VLADAARGSADAKVVTGVGFLPVVFSGSSSKSSQLQLIVV